MSTNFMANELATTERILPGLNKDLREAGLGALETADSPGLRIFRKFGGPGLVVSQELGGRGATLLEALHVQRVLGARSPSLALAVNMHVCTVLGMPPAPATDELLGGVAQAGLYLASGFGEGRTGASVLEPMLTGRRQEKGWVLSGSKKPCSLAHSMDFLTASVTLDNPATGREEMALAIVPANVPGISVRPFSQAHVLLGSETHEVVLEDVEVPDEYVSFFGDADSLNAAFSAAFFVFELLVSASYTGVASGLVETVLEQGRGTAGERIALVGELETVMAALEAIAAVPLSEDGDPVAVSRALFVRYSAQERIEQVAAKATELLGGMAFMGSGISTSRFTASRALAFHPPSRASMAQAIDTFVLGGPLVIP